MRDLFRDRERGVAVASLVTQALDHIHSKLNTQLLTDGEESSYAT